MEHRHLFGAGGLQILQQQSLLLRVEPGRLRGHDLVDVAPRLDLRVDAAHLQPRQVALQGAGQVRRRIGGAQVHGLATLHQADGQRRGDGGLADAALAHHHDQAVPSLGQVIGQCGQVGQRVPCPFLRRRAEVRRRLPGRQQRAQGRQADGIERAQRHPVLRQCLQRCRQGLQRLLSDVFDRTRHGVAAVAGMEHAVDHQALVVQAQLAQFHRGPGGLRHRATVGPGHQDDGCLCGVAQCVKRGLEARLLHLQARMRAQAGRPTVVALQEAGPGLGQAEQAQGVARGRGVEDDVVPGLRAVGQQAGELVERGDLGRAGPRQLLAHRGLFLCGCAGTHLRQHALAVRLGGVVGVDVEHRQAGGARHRDRRVAQLDAEHLVEI